jgi:hypothetical protein
VEEPEARDRVNKGQNGWVDQKMREWLRSLATQADDRPVGSKPLQLSDEGAAYLERIAVDGTLAAALAEIAASEPELAG